MICWKHKWGVLHIDTTISGNWHTGTKNRDDYRDYFIEFMECEKCQKRAIRSDIPESAGLSRKTLLIWKKHGEPTENASPI